MDPSRGDSRYNLNYSMSSIGLSLADQADLYGSNPAAVSALGGRPPSGGLLQPMGGSGGVGFSARSGSLIPNTTQCQSLSSGNTVVSSGQQRGIKRAGSDCYEEHHRSNSGAMTSQSLHGLESCVGGNAQPTGQQQQGQVSGSVPDVVDDSYNALQNKKSPPANGKKTKGRVKIKMEYIDNKLRRYTTFSKRKTGIMKKAYELSTLTGTQVMLLVASETGHVYTFATRKLQPMITSEAGKQLIQTCLNSPDPPSVGGGDQRMSATGFEETELSYNIADEDSKEDRSLLSSGNDSEDSSDIESPIEPLGNITKKKTTVETKQPENNSMVENTPMGESGHQPPSINSRADKGSDPVNPESLIYSAASLSNIPQDMLLQLIQSGRLQLHTEEDGSGHQYIAIPLTSTTSNSMKVNKTIQTCMPVKETKNDQSTKQMENSTITGVIIKQELD